MPATTKAATAAQDPGFQQRIRVVLVACSTECITQDNPARHSYAKQVLSGSANMLSAAYVIVADPTIQEAIDDEDPVTEDFGVTDMMLMDAVMPSGVPANGLFNTLSLAYAS